MIAGATYTLPVKIPYDLEKADRILVTLKNESTGIMRIKHYPHETETWLMPDGKLGARLSQQDTIDLVGNVKVEAQINLGSGAVAKTETKRVFISPTLRTEMVDGAMDNGDVLLADVTLELGAPITESGGGGYINIDDTLTVEGAAADAKVVGDKFTEQQKQIDEKQPAGDYALKEDIPQMPEVPVQSVNGQTGDVKLSAADVGAASKEEVAGLEEEIYNYIDSVVQAPRYGVSGVGGSNPSLTRIWDAEGLTAMVGTDTVDPSYHNDFDTLQPFARQKCVGWWSKPDEKGRARFSVGAYYGDPDYTEDGSKGDYVAVEVRPLWYYQDLENGIIGVSAGRQLGWKPHPVCVDEDGNIRAKTYLPCYELAVNDVGDAVSLPGYHTSFGHYQGLRNTCRTYGGGNNAAHLEPMAVRHYEWLLFTIEFATTHCQSVMKGAGSMMYNSFYKVDLDGTDVNHVVVIDVIGDMLVIGQTIYIGTTYNTAAAADALNIITAIEPCELDGTPNESGMFRRITYSGRTNTVTDGTTTITSRPWITGSCNDVTTPSGSPVSNTSGKYPMRYRYRENIWANCNSTCNDLFDQLAGAGTGDDPYHIIWHYLIDPDWFPASSSRPDATDFASESFKQLAQVTENDDGYIKQIEADPDHPECIVPVIQDGASASTYFADYSYFINNTTGVRVVRFGGNLYNDMLNGLLSFTASNVVSALSWGNGGGLYFRQ